MCNTHICHVVIICIFLFLFPFFSLYWSILVPLLVPWLPCVRRVFGPPYGVSSWQGAKGPVLPSASTRWQSVLLTTWRAFSLPAASQITSGRRVDVRACAPVRVHVASQRRNVTPEVAADTETDVLRNAEGATRGMLPLRRYPCAG